MLALKGFVLLTNDESLWGSDQNFIVSEVVEFIDEAVYFSFISGGLHLPFGDILRKNHIPLTEASLLLS